jgi:hypothetical protein
MDDGLVGRGPVLRVVHDLHRCGGDVLIGVKFQDGDRKFCCADCFSDYNEDL